MELKGVSGVSSPQAGLEVKTNAPATNKSSKRSVGFNSSTFFNSFNSF